MFIGKRHVPYPAREARVCSRNYSALKVCFDDPISRDRRRHEFLILAKAYIAKLESAVAPTNPAQYNFRTNPLVLPRESSVDRNMPFRDREVWG